MNDLRSYVKHPKDCFTQVLNTSKLVKKYLVAPQFFQPTSRSLEVA